MNAEQLHAVCKVLVTEISGYDLIRLLSDLKTELERSANDPNNKDYQNNIGNLRAELSRSLTSQESRTRPVSVKQIIDEIGGNRFLGNALLKRINQSFTQSQVTPHLVKEEIDELSGEFKEFLQRSRI